MMDKKRTVDLDWNKMRHSRLLVAAMLVMAVGIILMAIGMLIFLVIPSSLWCSVPDVDKFGYLRMQCAGTQLQWIVYAVIFASSVVALYGFFFPNRVCDAMSRTDKHRNNHEKQ